MEFRSAASLQDSIRKPLGTSAWRTLTLEDFSAFGRLSGDDGWIHTDPDRAARDSPFGTVIAQGSLLLSLVVPFSHQLFLVESARQTLNYGFDRVRFTTPVPANTGVRLHLELKQSQARGPNATLATFGCTIEAENKPKPAMVGDWAILIIEN